MKYGLYILLVVASYTLTSCNISDLETVEKKNPAGALIEQYSIDKDSLRQGKYLAYSDSGKLREEANYRDNKLNGTRTIFLADGNKEIVEQYDADKLNGPYYSYYSNGQIRFEATYNQDVLEGVTKKYYENGALMEEVNFIQNEENGSFREYYENGQPKWEGTYLDGDNEIGELRYYSETGILTKKLFCDSLHICKTIWTKEDGDIIKE